MLRNKTPKRSKIISNPYSSNTILENYLQLRSNRQYTEITDQPIKKLKIPSTIDYKKENIAKIQEYILNSTLRTVEFKFINKKFDVSVSPKRKVSVRYSNGSVKTVGKSEEKHTQKSAKVDDLLDLKTKILKYCPKSIRTNKHIELIDEEIKNIINPDNLKQTARKFENPTNLLSKSQTITHSINKNETSKVEYNNLNKFDSNCEIKMNNNNALLELYKNKNIKITKKIYKNLVETEQNDFEISEKYEKKLLNSKKNVDAGQKLQIKREKVVNDYAANDTNIILNKRNRKAISNDVDKLKNNYNLHKKCNKTVNDCDKLTDNDKIRINNEYKGFDIDKFRKNNVNLFKNYSLKSQSGTIPSINSRAEKMVDLSNVVAKFVLNDGITYVKIIPKDITGPKNTTFENNKLIPESKLTKNLPKTSESGDDLVDQKSSSIYFSNVTNKTLKLMVFVSKIEVAKTSPITESHKDISKYTTICQYNLLIYPPDSIENFIQAWEISPLSKKSLNITNVRKFIEFFISKKEIILNYEKVILANHILSSKCLIFLLKNCHKQEENYTSLERKPFRIIIKSFEKNNIVSSTHSYFINEYAGANIENNNTNLPRNKRVPNHTQILNNKPQKLATIRWVNKNKSTDFSQSHNLSKSLEQQIPQKDQNKLNFMTKRSCNTSSEKGNAQSKLLPPISSKINNFAKNKTINQSYNINYSSNYQIMPSINSEINKKCTTVSKDTNSFNIIPKIDTAGYVEQKLSNYVEDNNSNFEETHRFKKNLNDEKMENVSEINNTKENLKEIYCRNELNVHLGNINVQNEMNEFDEILQKVYKLNDLRSKLTNNLQYSLPNNYENIMDIKRVQIHNETKTKSKNVCLPIIPKIIPIRPKPVKAAVANEILDTISYKFPKQYCNNILTNDNQNQYLRDYYQTNNKSHQSESYSTYSSNSGFHLYDNFQQCEQSNFLHGISNCPNQFDSTTSNYLLQQNNIKLNEYNSFVPQQKSNSPSYLSFGGTFEEETHPFEQVNTDNITYNYEVVQNNVADIVSEMEFESIN